MAIFNPMERSILNSLSADAWAERNRLVARMNEMSCDSSMDRDLSERVNEIMGVSEISGMEDDDCDSPEYTFCWWASRAIDGHTYKRKKGPDVRYLFTLGESELLEVRPVYETIEAAKRDHDENQVMFGLDGKYVPLNDSNWQLGDSYVYYIYKRDSLRQPIAKGWFNRWEIVSVGSADIAEKILARLWEIHQNPDLAFTGLPFCGVCRKPLTDEISKALGIGPSCAKQYRISHSHEAVRKLKAA